MTRRRDNLGFTLMELVLVLVIIAVAAAVAVPALKGFVRSRRLPNTAQDLMTVTRWCRAQAVSEGVTYRLYLDVDNNGWSVAKDANNVGDGLSLSFTQVVTDYILAKNTLPDGIEMRTDITPDQEGLTYIAFDPAGRSDVGTIQLTCDGDEVDVVCDTPLGSYRVVKVSTQ